MGSDGKSRERQLTEVLDELRRFARRLRREWSIDVPEITFAESTLLSAVAQRPDATAVDIALELQIDKSTTSRQLAALDRRGLITRRPAPGERRAQLLELTPEGRRILDASDATRRHNIDRRVADWTDAEVATFADLLRRFNA